jgi:glycosyltransferase involved in cell wall biosynthesis
MKPNTPPTGAVQPSAKRVTVVIPTRNREALLGRLLGQLLDSEAASRHEVIVVDEASSDGTPELLDRLARESRLTVIRHDDPVGLSGARNVGMMAARTEYVGWIDDDDLTAPDRLIRQLEGMERTGRSWACAGSVDIDDDLRIIGHRQCPPANNMLERLLAFNSLPATGQGLLVRRDLAIEVGGFDLSLRSAEDWEFCIRLAEHGDPYLLNEPLVGYRTGYASMSTNTAVMDTAIAAVFDKHSALRDRLGVEPDWGAVHQSLFTAELLNSRSAVLRRSRRLLRHNPTPRNVARCVAGVVSPGWWLKRSEQQRSDQVPDAWRRSASAWLANVGELPA